MEKKRQVILIMTDTTRWDMLGCYGNTDIKTPNLDKLAAQGIRFNRAYTCQPVCGPARSAIFTGTYPHSNGSWGNSMAIGDNVKTIGQRLQDKGIHTAYIGKWHVDGGDYFGLGKCPAGWDQDYWYDMRCYIEELSPEERVKSRSTKIMAEESVNEEFTFGHRCSNRAMDFITQYGESDFFLTVSYDEPHDPYLCPEPYASMYKDYEFPCSENVKDTLEDKPEHQKIWAGNQRFIDRKDFKIMPQYYLGCNSYVDYEIGRVLKVVEELVPNALVIFTSDHGEFLNSHCLCGKGPAAYDEITRIPLIIKGGVEDTEYRLPVSHIDLAPTIMEYMGLQLPKLFEGSSLLGVLANPQKRINEFIFIEFGRYEIDHDGFGGLQPMRTIFDGQYKLTINLLSEDELYDLERDSCEMHNLILDQSYVSIRNLLHDRLMDWMNETRDPFRGYYWERRPWRLDASEASWRYKGYTRQRENEEYEPRQLDYATGLEMINAVRIK